MQLNQSLAIPLLLVLAALGPSCKHTASAVRSDGAADPRCVKPEAGGCPPTQAEDTLAFNTELDQLGDLGPDAESDAALDLGQGQDQGQGQGQGLGLADASGPSVKAKVNAWQKQQPWQTKVAKIDGLDHATGQPLALRLVPYQSSGTHTIYTDLMILGSPGQQTVKAIFFKPQYATLDGAAGAAASALTPTPTRSPAKLGP